MIEYLEKGKTINEQCYASWLRQFTEAIKSKRRGKLRAGLLLVQDNVSIHTAHVEAASCVFELLPHLFYSKNFAPSDFF